MKNIQKREGVRGRLEFFQKIIQNGPGKRPKSPFPKNVLVNRYSLCIWFAESGDFGIGYWEYSNMGPFTVELRAGA